MRNIYDITVPISEKTPVYEGDPAVEIESKLSMEDGDAANVSQICMGVHTGTHVDAPNHFIVGTKKVIDLDLGILIGECRVIEIAEDVMAIGPEHVAGLEGIKRVLFKTRNSSFWNDFDQGFRKDFTYIEPEAAQILTEGHIKLVGIDYLSVEAFDAEKPETHIAFLQQEVIILEGLDLSEVPAGRYELICLPLKIAGGMGDGSPARTVLREIDR
ncbi:MAG: cyclase family protein [Pyrinomonadaceae bacterium]|nr:cyclase family protein [Pyrinomonadaceae bacterium]